MPVAKFQAKFGDKFGGPDGDHRRMAGWLQELVDQFLHEKENKPEKDGKGEKEARAAKADA